MSEALALLRTGLAKSFAAGPRNPETWSDPSGMEKARARVAKEHGGAGIEVDPQSILAAIADFCRTGETRGFRELKYVCLGVGAINDRGWCVLSDAKLRDKVYQLVEGQEAIHRRMRCFQALLSAYWTFPRLAKATSDEARTGWIRQRSWLRSERERLRSMVDHAPPWFDALARYAELLTDRPCDRFGAELLRGETSRLNDALDSLAIPRDSWVLDEAVYAQMKAAWTLRDDEFTAALPDLLSIAMGRTGMEVGEPLRIRCVALLVSRYARCAARPEQPALRDAATSTIGNPWLRKPNWDAWVLDGDRPDDRARGMVFGWLKSRLIADFFELLSVDGINDRRRLAYWLRFMPFITDMWFALGSAAQSRRGSQFDDFRERARGRLLDLEGTTADNNAFVMRIGEFLAVEFGATGNAFYLLRWNTLPPAVMRALTSGKFRELVSIGSLKPARHEHRQSHMDSPTALKSWEQKFDDGLCALMGVRPEARPACVPELEKLLVEHGVGADDLRSKGGALWVRHDGATTPLARNLMAMGFARRQGRGWWKE